MIKSYFKIAWRNLVKNKTTSFVNILGLTGSTICCLYILLYVKDQYSFDDHHRNADQVYRITTEIITNGRTETIATTSPVMAPAVHRDFPEVEEIARVVNRADVNLHLLKTGDKSFYI